jgi:hypothetical protein
MAVENMMNYVRDFFWDCERCEMHMQRILCSLMCPADQARHIRVEAFKGIGKEAEKRDTTVRKIYIAFSEAQLNHWLHQDCPKACSSEDSYCNSRGLATLFKSQYVQVGNHNNARELVKTIKARQPTGATIPVDVKIMLTDAPVALAGEVGKLGKLSPPVKYAEYKSDNCTQEWDEKYMTKMSDGKTYLHNGERKGEPPCRLHPQPGKEQSDKCSTQEEIMARFLARAEDLSL